MKKSDIFNHFIPFSPTFFYFQTKKGIGALQRLILSAKIDQKGRIFRVIKWENSLFLSRNSEGNQ